MKLKLLLQICYKVLCDFDLSSPCKKNDINNLTSISADTEQRTKQNGDLVYTLKLFNPLTLLNIAV